MFRAHTWAEVFTPDDDIGRLVPLGKRRASGRQQLGLTDDNGTLQDCIAESFSSGHQVFVLIHVNKALTSSRVILGRS